MDFKFGVLVAIVAQICVASALPPCVCTRNYKPVCASNGQEYANECLMECAGKDLTVSWEGPCNIEPENCVCPFIYRPVCGSDGTTYPSRCNLDCQQQRTVGLEVRYEGECSSQSPQEPPCTCTRETKPVCGSDGNTYSNSCLLNCATKDNSMLSIEHAGPCVDRVKVVDFKY